MAEQTPPVEGEILLYSTPKGNVRVEVFFQGETFWLTQARMAELFGTNKQVVSHHLRNIFESKELDRAATVKEILTVQTEGSREVSRPIEYYNLDAIIAVGYRVNSFEATQFRIWATRTLREFIIKGFVLDDERLAQGKKFGADYFEELLERIRAIRASERRFYLKVTDLYEQCSIDYRRDAEVTRTFFKTVQDKLHWAITGKTAAEIVAARADAAKPNMGLTTLKNAPGAHCQGRCFRGEELLGRGRDPVPREDRDDVPRLRRESGFAPDRDENAGLGKQARRFPSVQRVRVLRDAGRVSHEVAKRLAETEYEKYRRVEDDACSSDFEMAVKQIAAPGKADSRRTQRNRKEARKPGK